MGLFGRKKEKVSADGIAYAIWSCLGDFGSCEQCKNLEGTCWIPGVSNFQEPPNHTCSSGKGCRCLGILVSETETGAKEAAAFIRKSGGVVDAQGMDRYHQFTTGNALEQRQKKVLSQREASAISLKALQVEKSEPETAISLYRESIELHKNIAYEYTDDPLIWNDLPYLFNRLTMLLERDGKNEASLAEIAQYETLPCQDKGAASYRDAIAKRKRRLSRTKEN